MYDHTEAVRLVLAKAVREYAKVHQPEFHEPITMDDLARGICEFFIDWLSNAAEGQDNPEAFIDQRLAYVRELALADAMGGLTEQGKPGFRVVCRSCQARIILPMPDAWEDEDGDPLELDANEQREEMAAQMAGMACPNCGMPELHLEE